MARALTALAALGLVGFGCGGGSEESGAPRPPNVLWVVWDTVRADRLSLYGHAVQTTPRLDAWAAEARVFDDVLSAANTTEPSHASMFTGLLPTQHGTDASNRWLADELVTIAERLQGGGYATYLWAANPHISGEENFQQGFDRTEHPWDDAHREAARRIVTEKVRGDPSTELASRLARPDTGSWAIKAAGELAQVALLRWLDERDHRPWLAVLNYMEAHRPLIPAREYRERVMPPERVEHSYRVDRSWLPIWAYTAGLRDYSPEDLAAMAGTYDAALAELDDLFGDLLAALDEQGALDDTVVILTSDHGELLGEHHMLDHQYSLHRPLLRVPLVIHYPERFAAGRDARPVMTLDLYPTLLELAGLAPQDGVRSPARSLLRPADARARVAEYSAANLDPLRAVERQHPGFEASSWDRTLRALQDGRYEFIWASDGRHELYDLLVDPRELDDLAARETDIASRMEGDLGALVEALGGGPPERRRDSEPSPQMREMLEGLGYLDAAPPAPEEAR